MKYSKQQSILKGLAVVLADILTIWMMVALFITRAVFFPWSISYLLLSGGLVTISMLFYRSLMREVSRNFAISFAVTSFALWGYTVALTVVAFLFAFPFLYHGAFFLGFALFLCYNITTIRRIEKVAEVPKESVEKEVVPENRGPDMAILALNLGDSMVSLRPYLLPEDYANLEKAYWDLVDSMKDLPSVSQETLRNGQELEKNITAKLAEVNTQMKLIPDAPGDRQRVLITEVLTAMILIKGFAENLHRLSSD